MFKRFFALNPGEINRNCIICPANDAVLFADGDSHRRRGLFFKTILTKHWSVISLKNNFLVSDCILLLKRAPCENIILFGPCGTIEKSGIGKSFIAEKSYNFESPSNMLKNKSTPCFYASKILTKKLSSFLKIRPLPCATVNSLTLEKKFVRTLKNAGVAAIDMESSIVFSHSAHIKRKSAAVFYGTDLVTNPNLTLQEKEKIKKERKKLSLSLENFIKNELT